MDKFFKTSFGDYIEFVENYKNSHNKKTVSKELLAEFSSNPVNRQEITYPAFLKDIFIYSLFKDALLETGIKLDFNNALDLGGAEGTISRLMKMERISKSCDVIEIFDMSKLLSDDLFLKHLKQNHFL